LAEREGDALVLKAIRDQG